jgi:phage gp29-like protein
MKEKLADSKTLHAPSVRVFTEWTPGLIRAAERMAEHGDLTQAVTICEWLLTDDRITGALEARLDALLGLEPTFEPGKGRKSKQVLRKLEADEDWWEAYPEGEVRQILKWGILLGVAPARHQWAERPDHGNRVLPMPAFWHPQTLKCNAQTRRWSVRDADGNEMAITPGDGEWLLHTPFGKSRPWSHGLWRSLARWVLLKQLAVGDWSRHSEKGSLLVATAPIGATQKQRRELADDLQASGADTVVALAAGFDMKMVEVSADTRAIYEAQIDKADLAIVIRIRGGNLTTNVSEGSRAAAETQQKTGDGDKLKADAAALSTTLHDQSLTWWAEFNFGDKRLAPWPVWPVEPEEDKGARATMVKTVGEALTILDKLGFEIDPKKTQEEFGLTFLNGRPREREADPVPGAAPAPAEGDKKPAKGKPAKKSARAVLEARSKVDGAVDGQLYVDDVTDGVVPKASQSLADFTEALKDAIKRAGGYEGVRAEVLKAYRDAASPEQLRDVTRKALVMAELAGTYSAKDG